MKIIRLSAVKEATGLGRSSIYKFMDEGTFPKSIQLTGKAVGWIDQEIEAWVQARIAERDKKS